MLPTPFIKLCCIASIPELDTAIAAGANALGLVSNRLGGPGVAPDDVLAMLSARARERAPDRLTVLLTNAVEADDLIEQTRTCNTHAVQLCEPVSPTLLPTLRAALPDVSWIQVVHVADESALGEAVEAAIHFDAVLLDSKVDGALDDGRPQLGGTGKTHDWGLSGRIAAAIDKPLILAGGLDAANLGEAIATARPMGVDVCSGIRKDGQVDPERSQAFVAAAVTAFSEQGSQCN